MKLHSQLGQEGPSSLWSLTYFPVAPSRFQKDIMAGVARGESLHLLTCKGCEQRTRTPHTLEPPDHGEAHLTDTFCLMPVQPDCWRPDSEAESHLSVASLPSSSFYFPVIGSLKLSRSWIHESGANLPCLAAWDGYSGLLSAAPSVPQAAFMPRGRAGGRHQEKTSPSGAALGLFIRLCSWYPSLVTFVELNLSWFLWLGHSLHIPGYQSLLSSRPCRFPAHPDSCPCWASKEQGSQGGAGGGWGSCLPSSHKQGSEGSFCMPRMPSMECCESKRYYLAGIKHEKLYFFKSVKLELPWCISGLVVIILLIL